MKDESAKVVVNERIARDVFSLRLATSWNDYLPGQFVMLDAPSKDTFLRRPFGIVALDGGVLEICYKVVGRGTKSMMALSEGSPVKVMGPLGSAFQIDDSASTAILVAGGYGVGPMLSLAEKLVDKKINIHFLYGAKSKEDIAYESKLSSMKLDLRLATEDGSLGDKGYATGALESVLKSSPKPMVFSCGPAGLLKAVAKKCDERKIPCQISVEAYMACGIGVCLGCACKDKEGSFIRACREGPVFKTTEIDYEALA